MRQAGRYLPNYQKFRQKYPLKRLFTDPDLASIVTMMPFEYLKLDAAIVFWDILLMLEPLGYSIVYDNNKPPSVVKDANNSINSFDYLYSNIHKIKNVCKVPLIGFCGGPFTVLSFLWKDLKKQMYQNPKVVHEKLNQITEVTIENLKGQIKSGIDAVQIFESSVHMLPSDMVDLFSTFYLNKILKELKCPTIVFGLGISQHIDKFCKLPCNALGIDWKVEIDRAKEIVPLNLALQGSFDPNLLFAPKDQIKLVVEKTLKKMNNDPGWIINLGHGILPDTPMDSVKFFIETINNYDRFTNQDI